MNPHEIPFYIDWLPDPTPKGPARKPPTPTPTPAIHKPRHPHRQSMRSVNRNH